MNRPPLESRNLRIFLTGFMGSGKSTIGPILANTLGFDFVDSDRLLEDREGKSVNEIFQEKGEQYFRALEEALIAGLCRRERIVVSLGGGSLVNERNLQAVATAGILVYLRTEPRRLVQRLAKKGNRPLLRDADGERLSGDQLLKRIEDLFNEREPTYRKADFTFETTDIKVGITVDQIVRALGHILP
jgi:shikimate kinase